MVMTFVAFVCATVAPSSFLQTAENVIVVSEVNGTVSSVFTIPSAVIPCLVTIPSSLKIVGVLTPNFSTSFFKDHITVASHHSVLRVTPVFRSTVLDHPG